MAVRPTRVPRVLGVLVIAFAQYERRPILGAVELMRGFGLQLAYRWATGCIAVDQENRAVLLWSVVRSPNDKPVGRQLLGLVAATAVGIGMVAFSGAVALAIVGTVLLVAGLDVRLVLTLVLGFVILRWLMTCRRAAKAYQTERSLLALAPPANGPRWCIDFLAALPPRSGHGGRLLSQFLDRADHQGVEVILHCEPQLVRFYRRFGFAQMAGDRVAGQRVMLRRAVLGSTTPIASALG